MRFLSFYDWQHFKLSFCPFNKLSILECALKNLCKLLIADNCIPTEYRQTNAGIIFMGFTWKLGGSGSLSVSGKTIRMFVLDWRLKIFTNGIPTFATYSYRVLDVCAQMNMNRNYYTIRTWTTASLQFTSGNFRTHCTQCPAHIFSIQFSIFVIVFPTCKWFLETKYKWKIFFPKSIAILYSMW